jgi:addiction module HigA family antidote
MRKNNKLKSVHPGEVLREEFVKPLGLRMNRMAHDLRVPLTPIADITHERRGITARTRYFKTSPTF